MSSSRIILIDPNSTNAGIFYPKRSYGESMSRTSVTIVMTVLLTISSFGISFFTSSALNELDNGVSNTILSFDPQVNGDFVSSVSGKWPLIDIDHPSNPENGSYINQNQILIDFKINNGSEIVNGAIDLDGSLRGWWRFDEGSWTNGTFNATDLMGNSNGYSINDTTPTDNGSYGNGLKFDGLGDSLVIPHDQGLVINDQITLEAWINSSSEGYIISKDSGGGGTDFTNFESGFGNWSNVGGDFFDWSIDYGGTPSSSTGPNIDHTYGTSNGRYCYTEASGSNNPSRDAYLESKEVSLGGSSEKLEFWYHMYGNSMGTLSVEISKDPYSSWSSIWSRSGQQHSSSTSPYTKASLSLASYSGKYKIRFHGRTGNGYRSDMAIDDIQLIAGADDSPFVLSTYNGGEFFINSRSTRVTGAGDINDGKWHHIVGTYDGYYLRLFVDGVRVGQNYHPGLQVHSSSRDIVVGRHFSRDNQTGHFNGTMDELKIHSRGLSTEEIQASMGRGGGLDIKVPLSGITPGKHTYRIFGQTKNGSLNCTSIQEFTRYSISPTSIYGSGSDPNGVTKAYPTMEIEANSVDAINIMGLMDLDGTLRNWWRMESSSGGRTYSDAGKTDHLSLINDTILGVGGRIGGYAYFDGNGDYMVSSSDVSLPQDGFASVSIFIRTDSKGTILSEGRSTNGWELKLDSSGFPVIQYGGITGPTLVVRSDMSLNDNKWHHLAAIMSTSSSSLASNDADLFIDGKRANTNISRTGYYSPPDSGLIVGAGSNGTSSYWQGTLDELVIYSREIDQNEIQYLQCDRGEIWIRKTFDSLLDGDHFVQCLFQNEAGNLNKLSTRGITIEYFTTNVTIPRDLWRSGVTYHLRENLYPDNSKKLSILGQDLAFDMHDLTIYCDNDVIGINLESRSNISIFGGAINGGRYGILSENSIGISVTDVVVQGSTIGIRMENNSLVDIRDIYIYACEIGIRISGQTTNNMIDDITGKFCSGSLVSVIGGSFHSITNISSDSNSKGVYVEDADWVDIDGITSSSDSDALYLTSCNSCTISNLTISGSSRSAVDLIDSSSNQLRDIDIKNCNDDGIILEEDSDSNIIRNATIYSVSGSGVALRSSNGNDLTSLHISYCGKGTSIESSHDTIFMDSIMQFNSYGMRIGGGSVGTRAIGLEITSSTKAGAYLGRSSNNIFWLNTIDWNGIGIETSNCDNSDISNNSIEQNDIGIYLSRGSEKNILSGNVIRGSQGLGIRIDSTLSWGSSRYNRIVNNDFIGNALGGDQAEDHGDFNVWNGSGSGNHWSNWISPDKEPDAVVDNPYLIPSKSYFPADNYPMVDPIGTISLYIPFNTTAYEDIEYMQRCFVLNPWEDPIWKMRSNARWLSMDVNQRLFGIPSEGDIGEFWVNISVTNLVDILWKNFSISVKNTNDPPVLETLEIPDLQEDTDFEFQFSASDHDPTVDQCKFEMTTDAGFLHLDEEDGSIRGRPGNEHVGSYSMIVIVKDQRGGMVSKVFDFSVLNSNDPPVITSTPVTTCNEDRGYYQSFKGIDIDPTDDVLNWNLRSDCPFLTMDEGTGILSGIPENEDVGIYTIIINLSDGNGGFDEISYELTVLNVNDPPEVIDPPSSFEIREDHIRNNILDLNDVFVDPEGDELIFIATSEGPLNVELSEDGTLSICSIGNWSGSTSLSITASDGKDSTRITVPVTVTPVNDAPYGISIILVDPIYREGETGTIKGVAQDPDLIFGDELSYRWISDISGDLGTGEELDIDLPPGVHIIELTVTDSEGEENSTTTQLVVFGELSSNGPGSGPIANVDLPKPGDYEVDPDPLHQNASPLENYIVIFLVILAAILVILTISFAISMKKRSRLKNRR